MDLAALLYEIGKYSGIVGFVLLSLLIFSGDTAKIWGKFFGFELQRIRRFLKKISYITAVFIIFHPLFFILSDRVIIYYILPDFSILPLALGIVALYIFIIVMIASELHKRISYTAWQYIHILIYVLFFFSIYHAFAWGSDSNKLYMQAIYLTSLSAVTAGIIYRTWYKIKNTSDKT